MSKERFPKILHILQRALANPESHILLCNLSKGRELIEERDGITHSAPHMSRNRAECTTIHGDMFLIRNILERANDVFLSDFPKREALAARLNRIWHLMELCGCEDKECMGWRFLECLEECIKCFLRHHVDFVDDVDLGCRAVG